jgi:hypothetical protein
MGCTMSFAIVGSLVIRVEHYDDVCPCSRPWYNKSLIAAIAAILSMPYAEDLEFRGNLKGIVRACIVDQNNLVVASSGRA